MKRINEAPKRRPEWLVLGLAGGTSITGGGREAGTCIHRLSPITGYKPGRCYRWRHIHHSGYGAIAILTLLSPSLTRDATMQ